MIIPEQYSNYDEDVLQVRFVDHQHLFDSKNGIANHRQGAAHHHQGTTTTEEDEGRFSKSNLL
jgi:hypothetical protein